MAGGDDTARDRTSTVDLLNSGDMQQVRVAEFDVDGTDGGTGALSIVTGSIWLQKTSAAIF